MKQLGEFQDSESDNLDVFSSVIFGYNYFNECIYLDIFCVVNTPQPTTLDAGEMQQAGSSSNVAGM